MIEEFLNEFTKELIISSAKPIEKIIQGPDFPRLQPFVQKMSIAKGINQKFMMKPMIMQEIRKPTLSFNQNISGDKIEFLLRNPGITSIECPGPGKFLIIRKGFRIEMTNISLTKEEIDRKIKEFSVKTKIPLIGGLFKANLGNINISAVISDYAGSRFIINKFFPTNIPNSPGS